MFRFLVLLGIVSTAFALLPFKLTDCSTSPNKILHVDQVKLSNVDPIRIPGNETLALDISILQPISGMHYKVELTVLKKVLFGYVIVPCFDAPANNTCVFELCDILSGKHYASDPHKCPVELSSTSPDFQCACPFSAGTYHINPTTVAIDNLPAYLKFLAQGDYKANVKITDTAKNNDLVGCYNLELSTGSDCTGISCLFGR